MKSMRTLYIPAFLTGLENVARRCYLPMGKENRFGLYKGKYDCTWFTNLAMFQHPHLLISFYYSGKFPEYKKLLRIRDDVSLNVIHGYNRKTLLNCPCPICQDIKTVDYFLENDITWPGCLLSLHNLWVTKHYVEILEKALYKDKKEFFKLVKQHVGGYYNEVIYSIENNMIVYYKISKRVIEICKELPFFFTISKYFGNIVLWFRSLNINQLYYEAGKQQNPTVDTIKKIAKALNVSIEDLIK